MYSPQDTAFENENSHISTSQEYQELPSNQLCQESHSSSEGSLPAAASNRESYRNKPLEEILSHFVPFDTNENLSHPFEEEVTRDTTFIQEQAAELMELMLETWAWNVSRIRPITTTEGVRLGEKLRATIETEKEQGMSNFLVVPDSACLRTAERKFSCADLFDMMCKRLQEFVLRMRSAIDALRGL